MAGLQLGRSLSLGESSLSGANRRTLRRRKSRVWALPRCHFDHARLRCDKKLAAVGVGAAISHGYLAGGRVPAQEMTRCWRVRGGWRAGRAHRPASSPVRLTSSPLGPASRPLHQQAPVLAGTTISGARRATLLRPARSLELEVLVVEARAVDGLGAGAVVPGWV